MTTTTRKIPRDPDGLEVEMTFTSPDRDGDQFVAGRAPEGPVHVAAGRLSAKTLADSLYGQRGGAIIPADEVVEVAAAMLGCGKGQVGILPAYQDTEAHDHLVRIFQQAWERADADHLAGQRTSFGIQAVLAALQAGR